MNYHTCFRPEINKYTTNMTNGKIHLLYKIFLKNTFPCYKKRQAH